MEPKQNQTNHNQPEHQRREIGTSPTSSAHEKGCTIRACPTSKYHMTAEFLTERPKDFIATRKRRWFLDIVDVFWNIVGLVLLVGAVFYLIYGTHITNWWKGGTH